MKTERYNTVRFTCRDIPTGSPGEGQSWARSLLLAGFIVFVLGLIVDVEYSDWHVHASASSIDVLPGPQAGNIDFSKFKHDNKMHARLPCLLCHKRESNIAQPTMPGGTKHLPCTGCHAQEFTNASSPVCLICHSEPASGKLKPFPRLESFGMRFDHKTHIALGQTSCDTCHRPARGGIALTIPAGVGGHTTCFGCHEPNAQANGRNISSCGTCHQPGLGRSDSTNAAAFRVGFRHDKHDRTEGLTCAQCHKVRTGQDQVTAPQPLNHHASARAFSCMSCHNGKRAFGGDDFSVCKRCHTGTAWRF